MADSLHCDILIIGAGIAGLRAALEIPDKYKAILLTKSVLGESATGLAQGGIAAAIAKPQDSPLFHFHDTLIAGAGLCNEEAVRILVHEGVERVRELIQWGAQFDRAKSPTGFQLAIEGAHRARRILHVGDATGKEIMRALITHIQKKKNIQILENSFVDALLISKGQCHGASAYIGDSDGPEPIQSKAVLLCSGGLGQIYRFTTNPPSATGDGVALAYRAGALVTDMEFVQFHPTALVHGEKLKSLVALPQFLISEAVRGEGGVLLNATGDRFMKKNHPLGELAPRDIVSRAIFQEMQETKTDHVFLSLKNIPEEQVRKRFPTIYKTCASQGIDITRDPIPVAPAAHYAMGGVQTDLQGRTSVLGLYAAGEVAACGVHGANRLASNSLLDGLVFGHRAIEDALHHIEKSPRIPTAKNNRTLLKTHLSENDIKKYQQRIKDLMWEHVGIVRTGKGLERAMKLLFEMENDLRNIGGTRRESELKNRILVASLITRGALERKESRGAHYRSDCPNTLPEWERHLTYRAG